MLQYPWIIFQLSAKHLFRSQRKCPQWPFRHHNNRLAHCGTMNIQMEATNCGATEKHWNRLMTVTTLWSMGSENENYWICWTTMKIKMTRKQNIYKKDFSDNHKNTQYVLTKKLFNYLFCFLHWLFNRYLILT